MKSVIALLGSIGVGLLCYIAVNLPAPNNSGSAKGLLSYDQFISISLTLATIVITLVALLMAYLSFVGKDAILEKANQAVAAQIEKLTIDFNRKIEKLIDEKTTEEAAKIRDKLLQNTEKFNLNQIPPNESFKEITDIASSHPLEEVNNV